MFAQHDLDELMRIGLAKDPEEAVVFTDDVKLPNFICTPNKKARKKFLCKTTHGQGSGGTVLEAKIRSVGEFYERLCLENPDTLKIHNSRYRPGADNEDPRLFACYSDAQFRKGAKEEYLEGLVSSRLDWYPVRDALSVGTTSIPASMVFIYDGFDDGCQVRREQISTGAAFGRKNLKNRAFESGLLEVVERDAYITSYLRKRHLAKITDFPQSVRDLLEYLERYNLAAHVFDITTDMAAPTFMTVTIDETGIGPAVDIGTSSGFACERAVYDSVKESVQARRTSRFLKGMNDRRGKVTDIRTLRDRYYYWYDTGMIRHLDFWLKNPETVRFHNIPEYAGSIDEVKSIMSDRGYHVYTADIATGEISGAGFEALKVVVPELHPLYLDESAKSLYSVHAGTIPDDSSLKPQPFT